MQQLQTTFVNLDPEGKFDWDNYSNMKDWPIFHIEFPDGRKLIFDLKKGIAFEQKKPGGPFYPLMVHEHWYKPASKTEDELDTDDSYFHYDFNQKGELVFTRLHCVNGVPTTPESGQVMSSVKIRLEGLTFILTEYTWLNGTPWLFGVPMNPLRKEETPHNKGYFPYSWHFPEEIEVVQVSDDFEVKESRILTWTRRNIGSVDVFQRVTFDGKMTTRAVLTDQKKRKVLFRPTGNPMVLLSKRSQFNWETGVMKFRGCKWTRVMQGSMAV
jgi:hypothetical protein